MVHDSWFIVYSKDNEKLLEKTKPNKANLYRANISLSRYNTKT